MDKKTQPGEKPGKFSFIKTFLLVFIPIMTFLLVLHSSIYKAKKRNILYALSNVEVHRTNFLAQTLLEHFDWITADLNYCANRYLASSMANSQEDLALQSIKEDFLLFARDKKVYDQIRVLDHWGREQIRINYNDGAVSAVPQKELQDKSLRYYFKDCMALEPGQIYLSPMDLNVENGKVEQPLKPMMRIGRPLLDGQGQKTGMLLLNFYGNHLLWHIRDRSVYPHQSQLKTAGQTMLVNGKGYWLVAPNSEDEWGFMFEDRKDKTFANRYPQEWQQMISKDDGHLLTENGFFAFATIQPPLTSFGKDENSFGKIISFVSPEMIEEIIYQEKSTFAYLAVLLGTLAIVVSALVAMYYGRKRKYELELAHSAFTDPLTGLLNRRAFQERLEFETERVDRYGGRLFMILGDIDHFKKVNDEHGHDAGDFVLKKIAAILNANLRSTDVLCRWGGEEFMVLVGGKAPDDGEKVAQKLRKAVEYEVMSFKEPELKVTMSFGVCSYRSKMIMEDLIRCSDEMLYASKRNGRNKVTAEKL